MQNPHSHQNFDDRLEDADVLCASCGEFIDDIVVEFDDLDEPFFHVGDTHKCCDAVDPHLFLESPYFPDMR